MLIEAYDPFLEMNPFFKEPRNYYEAHAHEILGSIVFYQILYMSSPYISHALFGKHYEEQSKKSKANFDIHIVSMVQCLISILSIVPLIGDKHLNESSVLNYTPYAAFVSSITIGYFVWDLWVCLKYFKLFGVGFLLHAVAALFVFSSTLRPFCLGWVASFLSFELSTPFVNINWFVSRLPAGTVSPKFVAINGLLVIITFFIVRIVWGFYAIYLVVFDMWAVKDEVSWFLCIVIVGLNFALDALNLFWFQKMVAIAAKKIRGGKTETKKSDTKKSE
ncbi:CYFA0S08e04258g1_1 [Cyberlindnera fabianii]|uniref:CYFA0S08e04258g1_1 n=1 Tax=Cyberlindnera fabianii TaxID=36022 RepID=A0A061B564_CYBFA|nr:Topoisomerase I damage affected protein 4 [Cyberlindnera fabianii]CDR42158.1 CYFA0S08e04258g1_1 [Cyberlindnera fabianii]